MQPPEGFSYILLTKLRPPKYLYQHGVGTGQDRIHYHVKGVLNGLSRSCRRCNTMSKMELSVEEMTMITRCSSCSSPSHWPLSIEPIQNIDKSILTIKVPIIPYSRPQSPWLYRAINQKTMPQRSFITLAIPIIRPWAS